MSDLRSRLLRACTLQPEAVTGVTGVTAAAVTSSNPNGYKGYTGYASVAGSPGGNAIARRAGVAYEPHPDRWNPARVPVGLPKEWRAGLAHLSVMRPPADFTGRRWTVGVWWSRRLAAEHGVAAYVMGWDAEDLFGLHPGCPSSRYDAMGLAFLLGASCRIVSLNNERAV